MASNLINPTSDNPTGNDHGNLISLDEDDHTQYFLSAGRAGGQVVYGGTDANNDLTLSGTSHATKTSSYVLIQPDGGDVGIGTTSPATLLHLEGTDPIIRIRDTDSPTTNYSEFYHSSNVGLVFIDRNATGTSTVRFSPSPTNGTSQANVEFFRSTNTTGTKRFLFKVGNNTNTNQHWISIGAATEFNLTNTSTDDFAIHGTTNNLFFADVSTNRVGIGTATPSQALQVVGSIAVSGTVDGRDVSVDGARLDVITDADYKNTGLTGTSSFGGGASGNIESMTFVNGLLTAFTTVP